MPHTHDVSVAIDVTPVIYGRGVSRYTSNLTQALLQHPEIRLSLLGYSLRQYQDMEEWVQQFGTQANKHVWRLPPTVVHKLWEHKMWPLAGWWRQQAQVFHAWDWHLGPVGVIPQVVTIHDLAYQLFPETAHPKVQSRYDALLATLEQHPELHVIAVSHATKNDIVNLTAIPPEQVTVVYEALPEEARMVPSQVELEQIQYQLPTKKPFLLVVGTTEPRKNIPRIIEAWEKISDQFDLVVAGAAGWDTLPQRKGIHYLGYVAPNKLAALYRLAHALVYASLYEGFGLPILEAYFHQCPVITSNVSSMAEIAGPAALLVDPYNPDMIAEACVSLERPGTKARQRRIKDMTDTLNNFSWQKTAADTVRVYKTVRGSL